MSPYVVLIVPHFFTLQEKFSPFFIVFLVPCLGRIGPSALKQCPLSKQAFFSFLRFYPTIGAILIRFPVFPLSLRVLYFPLVGFLSDPSAILFVPLRTSCALNRFLLYGLLQTPRHIEAPPLFQAGPRYALLTLEHSPLLCLARSPPIHEFPPHPLSRKTSSPGNSFPLVYPDLEIQSSFLPIRIKITTSTIPPLFLSPLLRLDIFTVILLFSPRFHFNRTCTIPRPFPRLRGLLSRNVPPPR